MKVSISVEGEVDAIELGRALHSVIQATNSDPDQFEQLQVDDSVEIYDVTVTRVD